MQSAYTFNLIDSSCNRPDYFTEIITPCENKAQCTVDFDSSWFDETCLKEKGDVKLYLKMYCKDTTISIIGTTRKKSDYSLIIVGVNVVTIVFYIIYLIFSKLTEMQTVSDYVENRATPTSYTIQLKNLPPKMNEQDLIEQLLIHFSTFWENVGTKNEGDKTSNPVVDISVAIKGESFVLQKKVKDLEEKMRETYQQLIDCDELGKKLELTQSLEMDKLKKVIHSLQTNSDIKNASNQYLLTISKEKGK